MPKGWRRERRPTGEARLGCHMGVCVTAGGVRGGISPDPARGPWTEGRGCWWDRQPHPESILLASLPPSPLGQEDKEAGALSSPLEPLNPACKSVPTPAAWLISLPARLAGPGEHSAVTVNC